MTTFQTRLLNEVAAGHSGPEIPESKRVYFQERFRARVFDFLIKLFLSEQAKGLTKAKLARRIGKPPEVVNRLLAAPSNMTMDTISDLLLGIGAKELEMGSSDLLNRTPSNYIHLDEFATARIIEIHNPPLRRSANRTNGRAVPFRYQPAA